MGDYGTFRRGDRTRRAATPAQAVKLKHDGWRKIDEAPTIEVPIFGSSPLLPDLEPVEIGTLSVPIHGGTSLDLDEDTNDAEDEQ